MLAIFRSRTAAALAGAAALSLTATPAMARGWHHRHDRGIDAGDVIAGVLIIGGIAAVASAASKSNRDRQARRGDYPDSRYPSDQDYRDYRDYRDRDQRYGEPRGRDDYPGGPGWRGAGSMDAAVEACAYEVERGNRQIESVDGVARDGDGWRVEGSLRDGRPFDCTAEDGRVRRMTIDGQGVI